MHTLDFSVAASITLTDGPDILSPNQTGDNQTTDGNDTVNGYINYTGTAPSTPSASSTLTAADSIDGDGGTNSLKVTVDGTLDGVGGPGPVYFPSADIQNIDKLFVRNVATETEDGDNFTIDASTNVPGASELWADRASTTVAFTNAATDATIGMKGNEVITNGDVDFSYATGTDAVNLAFDGGTLADAGTDVTASAGTATIANITSTGAANEVDAIKLSGGGTVTEVNINAETDLSLAEGDATNDEGLDANGLVAGAKVNVEGAGEVDLSTLDAKVAEVEGSSNNGGITVILGEDGDKFTGGTGDDVVQIAAVPTADVAAGEGTNTLVLGEADWIDSAADVSKLSGFDTLRAIDGVDHNAEVFDLSYLSGINAIEVNALGHGDDDYSFTELNSTQANDVTVRGDLAGDLTLSLADSTGSSDEASITFGTETKATEAYDLAGALVVNGFETLNLESNPGPSATTAGKVVELGSFTADKLTQINLEGESFDLKDVATTKAVTIDGASLNGTLDVAGDLVAGSTVTSSDGEDEFALGQVGSTYNAGAGDDAITTDAVNKLYNAGTYNVINAGDGEDTLTLQQNDVTLVDDDFKQLSGLEKFVVDADGDTNGESLTTGGWFDDAFSTEGLELDYTAGAEATTITASTFTGALDFSLTTAAAAQNTAVNTGDGNDTIEVAAASQTTGNTVVSAGAGNDDISITVVGGTLAGGSANEFTGGTGKDSLTINGLVDADATCMDVKIGAGDSTTDNYDSITGWLDGNTAKSVLLTFAGTAVEASDFAATTVEGYTSTELTIANTSGIVTFSGSESDTLSVDEKISAVESTVETSLDTVAFEHDGNTYVFNANDSGDSVVELIGVTGMTAVDKVGDSTAANTINIA